MAGAAASIRGAGVVDWFNPGRGFGFITPDDAACPDIFVHHTAIHGSGYRTLEPGEAVEYEAALEEVDGSLRALKVTAAGGAERAGAARYTDEERLAHRTAKQAGGPWWTARAKAREASAQSVDDAAILSEVLLARGCTIGPPPGTNGLEFVLVVDGPLTDRPDGPRASWAEADCAQKNRRDALVRSLVAAICSESDRCWLLFEEPQVVVLVTHAFIATACGGSTTEHTVLSQLDRALRSCCLRASSGGALQQQQAGPQSVQQAGQSVQQPVQHMVQTQPVLQQVEGLQVGAGSADGVSAYVGFATLTSCAAFILQAHSLTTTAEQSVLVNMHDTADAFLPVYSCHEKPKVCAAAPVFVDRHGSVATSAAASAVPARRSEVFGCCGSTASKVGRSSSSSSTETERRHSTQSGAQSTATEPESKAADSSTAAVEKVLVAMGVVHDHLSTVQLLVRTATLMGLKTAACNLGPVAEYTSKCIHIVQAHYTAGRFVPSITVRHPELKLKIPPWVFCVSWCPDFEFWGT